MYRILLATLALAAANIAGAQGVTDSQIVLGQSVALTGPAQQLGLDMQQGAALYFNQVNARGGVNGRRIVLKTLDDGYEATRAARSVRTIFSPPSIGYVGNDNADRREFSEPIGVAGTTRRRTPAPCP